MCQNCLIFVKVLGSFTLYARIMSSSTRKGKYCLHTESSPLVTRRYFVTCKSHLTSGGRDWEHHFLLGGGGRGVSALDDGWLTCNYTSLQVASSSQDFFLWTGPNSDKRVEWRDLLVTSTSQGTNEPDSVHEKSTWCFFVCNNLIW
jgi:hypothetical protein